MNKLMVEIFRNSFSGKRVLVTLIVAAVISLAAIKGPVGAEPQKPASAAAKHQLPRAKQTTIGLYVTAAEAYEMWKAAPDQIKVIDVRTPEEFAFVGHAEMAWNVPLAFVTYQRKDGRLEYGMKLNPDFIPHIREVAGPDDTLLVMCRSGGRSAMAVNQLAEAGLKNVYNIVDGMEGDKVKDRENLFYGKRMKNGWKNSGLPWSYGIDPERILIPEGDYGR